MKAVKSIILVLIVIISQVYTQTNQQKTEKLIRNMYQSLNEYKFDEAAKEVSLDFIDHIKMESQKPGIEGVKELFNILWKAFPDLKQDIIELIVSNDGTKVSALVKMYGTQKGEFMGMPATGNKIEVMANDIMLLKEGKVTDHWGFMDSETFMKQLGAGK